jgi:hypothetical protein
LELSVFHNHPLHETPRIKHTANAASIATRDGCSVRKVNMTISLAFLAPDLVKAAIEGRLPHGMGEISASAGMRGGPGRTRTSNQTVMSAVRPAGRR